MTVIIGGTGTANGITSFSSPTTFQSNLTTAGNFTAGAGGISSASLPVGSILQVVNYIPPATSIALSSLGSYTATPSLSNSVIGYSGSITLSKSTNKVFIISRAYVDANTVNYAEFSWLFRSSTFLASTYWYRRVQGSEMQPHIITYLDSPGSSGPLTYNVSFAAWASPTLYINQMSGYSGGSLPYLCSLTFMEISA